jgi:hypothetical protein
MSISSLSSSNGNKFTTIIIYVLALLGVASIVYFGGGTLQNMGGIGGIGGKATLSVENMFEEAEVFINDASVGRTPFTADDIKPGEARIAIKTANRQYETTITLLPNSQSVINRDLGVSENFSSGQDFWIEKSNSQTVLSITSEPGNAGIFIDNSEIGKTPFSSSTLTPGEYDLRIEQAGYESQSARIKIVKGHNLNIAVKLFPIPVPAKVNMMEGSDSLYEVISANNLVISDTQNWAKAVAYWNVTRGVNLAGLGVNKEPVFDYYIDYKGDLYTRSGDAIMSPAGYEELTEAKKGAYLGRTSDPAGLTTQATTTYETFRANIPGGKKAKVIETGTGWLRVRDVAGLNGVEVARVDVGGEYSVLEEQTEWIKIQVSETVQGWVSKTFVTIL